MGGFVLGAHHIWIGLGHVSLSPTYKGDVRFASQLIFQLESVPGSVVESSNLLRL